MGCVQAKLSYNNPDQNLITRWFTIEYAMWFSFFLPGLASLRAPIPLGGTSNHFRRLALRSLGGWDPYNVTEDADLGIRMFREGYTVRVLESVTLEEANSDFVNWVKQRSRWYKGYLQTFFVHMRSPRELVREMGWSGVAHFWIFVAGYARPGHPEPRLLVDDGIVVHRPSGLHPAHLPGPGVLPRDRLLGVRKLHARLPDAAQLSHHPAQT